MTPGTKQIILAGAPKTLFEADLKTTLVPGKAINGTPTFTRASAATVVDFEGLVKTVKSGEARFHGARRVENLLPHSTNLNYAGWSKYKNSSATDPIYTENYAIAPDGTTTAGRLQANRVDNSSISMITNNSGLTTGSKATSTVWLKSNTGSDQTVTIRVNSGTYKTFTATSNWQRFSTGVTTHSSFLDFSIGSWNTVPASTISIDILVWGAQMENVTGQANQNPSEYVSSGVLSAPYHGANVDGVKYLDYQNGNTVSSNVVTEASGAAISDSTLRGYLAEEQRVNYYTYSDDFSNAAWTKTAMLAFGAGSTANAVLSDVGIYADLIVPDTTNVAHNFHQPITTPSGTEAITIYAKPAGYTQLGLKETTISGNAVVFVLSGAGSIIWNPAGINNATITATAAGWYKITFTRTSTGVSQNRRWYIMNGYTSGDPSAYTYVGDGASGMYIAYAQVEAGAMPTSYIPTTSATVTRAADVLNYTATNVNNDTGAVTADTYINWSGSPANNATLVGIGSGTTAGLQISTSDSPTVIRMNDGTNAITKTGLDDASTGIRRRGAMWGSKGLYTGGNGLVSTQSTFDGLVEFSTLNIGQLNGSRHLNGTIRNVKVYQKQMTLTLFTRRVTSG